MPFDLSQVMSPFNEQDPLNQAVMMARMAMENPEQFASLMAGQGVEPPAQVGAQMPTQTLGALVGQRTAPGGVGPSGSALSVQTPTPGTIGQIPPPTGVSPSTLPAVPPPIAHPPLFPEVDSGALPSPTSATPGGPDKLAGFLKAMQALQAPGAPPQGGPITRGVPISGVGGGLDPQAFQQLMALLQMGQGQAPAISSLGSLISGR